MHMLGVHEANTAMHAAVTGVIVPSSAHARHSSCGVRPAHLRRVRIDQCALQLVVQRLAGLEARLQRNQDKSPTAQ